MSELSALSKEELNAEKRFRVLIENAPDGVAIVDQQGSFIYASPNALRQFGFTEGEITRHSGSELTHPDDLPYVLEHLFKVITDPDYKPTLVYRFMTKDRGYRWIETTFTNLLADDTIRGIVLNFSDITERKLAVESLRESEEKFSKAFRNSPSVIIITSVETGRIIDVNESILRLTDYTREEVLGKTTIELNMWENEKDRNYVLATLQHHRKVNNYEALFRKKSGEFFTTLISAEIIVLQQSTCILSVIHDISSLKLSEQKIKESEANLKAIVENSLDSIWSVNKQYEIQYVNKVFVTAFKKSFGVDLTKGFCILDAMPAELASSWKGRYDRVFAHEHLEFVDEFIDGESVMYVEVAMQPILVEGGVVGASMYAREITEKKLAANQLQYEANLRKLLIELSTDFINVPVHEIDPSINSSLAKIGAFVGADRAYIVEYDSVNQEPNNTFEWCSEGVASYIDMLQGLPHDGFECWKNAHCKGKPIQFHNVVEMEDSKAKQLLIKQDVKSLLSLPLNDGTHCFGFVGFHAVNNYHQFTDYEKQLLMVYAQLVVNISMRLHNERNLIAAKEKAQENDRLKTAFLQNMSHEIRTPMNGILGFVELLKEPDLTKDEKEKFIGIVEKSGQRLLNTINDILEISKIEAGQEELHYSKVNTEEVVHYFYEFFKEQAISKQLSLKITRLVTDEAAIVVTDKYKLESVFGNLINNALKFTFDGGIEIGTYIENDEMVFFVQDTGMGIPAERLNVIFDRFVQADLNITRPHEGSGLGLSIVKGYVDMMGGDIRVQSVQGEGTSFCFTIPYHNEVVIHEKQEVALESAIEKTEEIEQGGTILLAEDDQVSFMVMRRMLVKENYEVMQAINGIETIEMLQNNPHISLILMDIKMPVMNGFEATREIRKFNMKIPIIAQTAYALSGDREKSLEAGCNDYISKPIHQTDLIRMIRKYIKHVPESRQQPS
ncbi:MAG: PAS domain S-box protein [Bacteroidales bacterium]|nr:PAS domain S-box protein [Bacteroidales bacterium]